jgi:8-oxo-dGTP pyrophosphatase MutT (NUDIX family)
MTRSPASTITQTSAGGVAFRRHTDHIEIALISVGKPIRWQLPKGLVDDGESLPETAKREVREEAGINTEIMQPLETIDYWYYGQTNGQRMRYHKFVHFFLMRYLSGDVTDHDDEVHEARWFEIDEAIARLAFESEKDIVRKAKTLILS